MPRFLESGSTWGIALVTLYVIFLAFGLTAICLRLWARKIKKFRLRLNDWAIIVAWIFSLGLLAIGLTAIYIGGGVRHIQYTTLQEIINLLKLFLAGQMLWAAANTAVKLSILDLYIQIFRNKSFRILSYVLMAASIGYLIMVILEAFLVCKPFAYSWNKFRKGHCDNQLMVYVSSGIVNLFIDVVIVILPMPMLWGLQLSLHKKLALTFIFGLGAVICVISTVRLVELVRLDLNDVTYNLAKVAVWTGLEPMLGVINACLPVIQPVVKKVLESNIFSRSSRNRSNNKVWMSGSSKAGKKSNTGDVNSFRRLEETSYPLTEGIGTLTQISNPQSQSYSTSDNIEAQNEEKPPRSHSTTINVRRDWAVQIEPAGAPRS